MINHNMNDQKFKQRTSKERINLMPKELKMFKFNQRLRGVGKSTNSDYQK